MNTRLSVLIAILLAMTVIAGCSADHAPSMMTGNAASAVTITPKDGATGVRLDAPVALSFARPADRAVTERNVHLFSQRAMADSACPMGMLGGAGMMDAAMHDSTMMRHLIGQHMTAGRFQWDSAGTLCTFAPDSLLQPNMNYMIHLGREMSQMLQRESGGMDMMGGHGTGMMAGDMMFHFGTMDSTDTNGGHR